MNANHRRQWDTASSDDRPDTTPAELSALQDHLNRLQGSGRRTSIRRAAQALRDFFARHLAATLLVLTFLVALVALIGVAY